MQIKALSLSVTLGLFLVVAMMGCDDHGHSHDNGNFHESVNQETDKTNSNNHNTID
ncbi:MAG: hypothetical protein ABFS39_15505 [Pseudomonadota bacterium]